MAADNGGGIDDNGLLTVMNSTIEGNTANGVEGGGGIFISADGSATLENSTVVSNQAWIGGGIFDQGILTIKGSLFSGNRSTETQGSVPTGGGVIAAARSDSVQLKVKNSRFIGNQAPQSIGGGISVIVSDAGAFQMTGSILAGNHASDGGGIAGGPGSVSGSCFLGNTASLDSTRDIDGNLQAGDNWWGAGNLPHVSRGVTVASTLSSPPDICASEIPTPYLTIAGPPVSQ